MKYLLLTFLLVSPITDINKIARTNALKKEAKEAFLKGNYRKAIQNYHYLLDSMGVEDDDIRMNLANAYYEIQDTTEAINNYNMLRDSDNKLLSSRAYQQLGVIKNKQKKQEEALSDFKQALRKNPYNEEARYNYELLKKLLDEQKEKEQQDQKQDKQQQKDKKEQEQQQNQQQQDQQKGDKPKEDQQKQEQQQEQKNEEGKESEQEKQEQKSDEQKEGEEQEKKNDGQPQEPSDEQEKKEAQDDLNISPDKLKEMNLTEEKARMILEAMRNQEIQYLQQNKRKSEKRPASGKPDW